LGLRKGTPEAGKEMSLVTGYLRRRLSSFVMRTNVKCLLERLLLVGEGQGQAGKRREWARREEARETGEGSLLAGEDNRQKPLPKRRLSSTVIFVMKLCLLDTFDLLLNKLS